MTERGLVRGIGLRALTAAVVNATVNCSVASTTSSSFTWITNVCVCASTTPSLPESLNVNVVEVGPT